MARISRKEAEAREYATAEAETKYYDMLYNFFGVVSRANEQSFAGYQQGEAHNGKGARSPRNTAGKTQAGKLPADRKRLGTVPGMLFQGAQGNYDYQT